MSAIYLVSLIVGGGLLLFSVFGGDAGAADGADVELDLDGDGAFELDGDAHLAAADGLIDGSGTGLSVREFLSVRALIYFLAGFGGTGFLLGEFTTASSAESLVWAVITGLVASTIVTIVYGWLRRTESGLVPRTGDHLVGLPASVLLPVEQGRRGKIIVVQDDREIELLARLYGSGDPACDRGTTVVIVDMDGDTALVTPVPELPSTFDQEY